MIGVFGLVGVFARYFLGISVNQWMPTPFPYGTFLINILGSFLIGVIYIWGVERSGLSEDLRIGLIVGLLGGFTTFSSYSVEVFRLLENQEYRIAALYFILSPVLGLISCFAGALLARLVLRT